MRWQRSVWIGGTPYPRSWRSSFIFQKCHFRGLSDIAFTLEPQDVCLEYLRIQTEHLPPRHCLEVRFLVTSFLGLFPSLRESPRWRSWWYYHLKGSVSNHFLCLFGFWYQFLFKKPKNGSWTSCCIRCCELTFIICYALRALSRLLSIRGRSNDKNVLMITLTNSYFLS